MSEKLQKVLARAGHGSRREIESIIEAGRVSVDGKIAKLGDRVEITPRLKIRIDGQTPFWPITNRKVSCVPVTIRKGVQRCLTVCQNCVAHAGLP